MVMTAKLILSRHEKGFPMADYYADYCNYSDDEGECGPPDGYKTGRIGESMESFRPRVAKTWPGVEMEELDEEEHDD
jgi:hypothetical protein